ncbi:RHS repeat-associated core domain-containing protein [Pseudomonas asiatica]|uniref:RHS repeat-associated core domain-containing protein n=1 Tax=Pseudomonas asiatica TaxID=2219225 RepID=UPI00383A1F99
MDLQRRTLKLFYCDGDMHTSLRHQGSRTVFRVAGQSLAELRVGTVDSVSLLSVNNSGSVVGVAQESDREQFDYTAYGHCSSLSSGRSLLGFNGEYYDDFLQGYMLGNGYRLFNGMRFNSPDSFAPFSVLGAYGYCNGDPVNYVDPSGHAPWWPFSRISYFKMKRVLKNVEGVTKLMNSVGSKKIEASAHPRDVASVFKDNVQYVNGLMAKLERMGAKEGSNVFRALDRKHGLRAKAAEFRNAAEIYKGEIKKLQARHLSDYENYVALRDHNAPIQGAIYGLESKIKYLDARRQHGKKSDYNLSDREYSELARKRKIHNKPIDKEIDGLEREVSNLRKQLI